MVNGENQCTRNGDWFGGCLIVSLFQALTQIQEMTLAYVPKILAIFIALWLFLPFMSQSLNEFMIDLADRIVKVE